MAVSELGLTALAFLTGLSFAVVSPVLPLYVESLGVSYEALGLFFSAYALTWGLLQLYTGYLSDRYGRARFVLAGVVVYGLLALACFGARDFVQLLLSRMGQGVGLGLFGPALLGLVGGMKRRHRAFALYRTAGMAGEIIGPLIGGYVGRFGLGHPFLISAGASGLALLPALFLRGEPPGREARETVGFLAAVKAILSRRGFLLLSLGTFLAEMGYVARGIAVPLVGGASGLSTEQIGLVMSTYSLAFVLFQVPIGVLAERTRPKALLVICGMMAALAFGGLAVTTRVWGMALAMGVLGVTLGTIFVQSTAWAADLVPEERRSLYLASFDALIDLSFPVTPLVLGPLIGLSVRLPFVLCVALLLASAWVLSRVPVLARPETTVGE